jgi:hypothetical protein
VFIPEHADLTPIQYKPRHRQSCRVHSMSSVIRKVKYDRVAGKAGAVRDRRPLETHHSLKSSDGAAACLRRQDCERLCSRMFSRGFTPFRGRMPDHRTTMVSGHRGANDAQHHRRVLVTNEG